MLTSLFPFPLVSFLRWFLSPSGLSRPLMVLRLTQSTTYHRSPFSSVQYSEARSLCERYMGRRTVRSNLWCFCEPSRSFAHVALPLPVTLTVISRAERYLRMIMNHLNVAMYILVYSGHLVRKTTCQCCHVRVVSSLRCTQSFKFFLCMLLLEFINTVLHFYLFIFFPYICVINAPRMRKKSYCSIIFRFLALERTAIFIRNPPKYSNPFIHRITIAGLSIWSIFYK